MIEIEYSQDFDALIKQKQKEISELQQAKNNELYKFLKKNSINCDTCRYSWLDNVGDMHTFCEMGFCKLCRNFCEEYKKETKASAYLRNCYNYEDSAATQFEDMFCCKMADASLEKVQKFMEMYKMK